MKPWYRAALIVSLGFCLPFLGAPLFADDYFHQWVLGHLPTAQAVFGMFRFEDSAHHSPIAVWWVDPGLHLSFFRPLSGALAAVEHAVGLGAAGQHAISLLLFGLLLVAVADLFGLVAARPRAGVIGFAVYAFSDLRALAVGWIAVQHLLLSTLLAVVSISQWLRFRRDGRRTAAALSLLAMACGLLASENAIGGIAFIIAFEWSRGGNRKSALGWAAFAAAYALGYSALGFGTSHSGLYTDFVREPGTWLKEAAIRIPALAGGAVAGLPLDLWLFLGREGHLVFALIAAVCLVVFLPALRPWKPSSTRWMAVAGLAAIIPMASASASSRLLMLPGVAFAFVIGSFLDETPLRGYRGSVAALLWARHVLLAPLILLMTARAYTEAMASPKIAFESSPALRDLTGRHVIMLDVGDPFPLVNPHGYFWDLPKPPTDVVVLNASTSPVEVERAGPASLRLRTVERELLTSEVERIYRAAPIAAGFRSRQGLSYSAAVEAANPRGATQVRFDFAWPLDDPRNLFLHWDGTHYVQVAVPVTGSIRLDASPPGIGRLRLK